MKNKYSIVALTLLALFVTPSFADPPYIDDAYYWNDGRHAHESGSQTEPSQPATQPEASSASGNTSSEQKESVPVDIQYVNVQDTTITVKINR